MLAHHITRYARHIALPEIGTQGHQRIAAANIAVIGAGGLGAPCLQYLVASGVGHVTLIDHDIVSIHNLQRQILFETADIGSLKTEAAAQSLHDLNAETSLTLHSQKLTSQNAASLLAGHDLIIDGTDRVSSRYAANDAALVLKIPYLSGAVIGFNGQVALFTGHEAGQPCYRCVFPHMEDAKMQRCSENGVFAPACGMVGSMMASMALQFLLGMQKSAILYRINTCNMALKTSDIIRDTACLAPHLF